MKKIDVLMATYNGEKYVEEQINSVLLNFSKCENYDCNLLISDDASADSTQDIIKKYSRLDNRIKVLDCNKKGGVRENFNYLINNTNADYVFFCDQDDFWLPEKINIFMHDFLKMEGKYGESEPILIHSDLCVASVDLSPLDPSMFQYQNISRSPSLRQLVVSNSVTGCVMACNKSLILLALKGRINESIMHDWYLAILASAFGKISFVNKSLILYRQHGQNQVGAKSFSLIEIFKQYKFAQVLNKAALSVSKTKEQAEHFFSDYEKELAPHQRIIFESYINSFNLSCFNRLICFLRGFRKKGIVRNIVFLYTYVMKGESKKNV